MKKKILLVICLLPALLLFLHIPVFADEPQPVPAVNPVSQSENYKAVLYNNTNGLPTSEANDIAQTSEGFIWIASYSGLIRYDGQTFERMYSTSGIASVVRLHVDKKDRLWIGTNDNGIALLDHGKLQQWNENDGLGSAKIRTIVEDNDGRIYVGTTAGITIFDEELKLHPLEDPQIADVYMESMHIGPDGLFYCATNEADFFILRGSELVTYIDHTKTCIQNITVILPDPDKPGKVYVGTTESVLYHGDLTQDIGQMEKVDISPLYNVGSFLCVGDQIWISARNGVGIVDNKGVHLLEHLPMDNSIRVKMIDYAGNIWFTSSRQGVMKLVQNQFSDLFARYGLQSRVVNSTCVYNNSLFIATDTGLIVLDKNGEKKSLPLQSAKTASGKDLGHSDLLELLNECRIRSITQDSRGRLWISVWHALGLLCYDGSSLVAFTPDEGLLSDRVRAVCEAEDGAIIVAVTGGVNVIRDGRVVAGWGESDGISNSESLTVASAPNGDIVLGSNGGGIYIIDHEGAIRCVGTKDGLTSGVVMRIKYDQANHVFWLITGNSISWMTEDYQVSSVRNFPYPNNFDLYENSKGDMWVLSSDGIYVVPTKDLLANGEIKAIHYGIANGLPYIPVSNSYSTLTKEGDLYIACSSGVAKVNIEASMEDISVLKQAVPYIDADGVRIYPNESGGFTVPSNVHKLTIYGFVFNYSLTDPQISYRLEGFDKDAVTVSRSEFGPVTYTNLPGGSYRFVMDLKDSMGRGSKPLSVSIVKEKAIYEQPWFYIVVGLFAITAAALLIRVYVRRKMQILEEKHREDMNRERLENELQMATQIQANMMPRTFPAFPERKEFDLYASMDPAKEVGGDFYDYFLIDDDHLGLVIADVSGKGIPAALFMTVSKALIRNCAMSGLSPAETLESVNRQICANNQEDMFVTVWIGVLEISTGKLTAANAGHEYPVFRTPNDSFTLYKDKHGLVIGGIENVVYQEYEIQLTPGTKLFVYTDGVPEATDPGNEMFGIDRMLEALNQNGNSSPEATLRSIRHAVDSFVGDAEQFDDLTMLCFEYRGLPN